MLAVGLLLLMQLACEVIKLVNPPMKKYRYVFPDGAHGKYVVRFLVEGAPPLPTEDGYRLVRFTPALRTIDTSDEYIFGGEWSHSEQFAEAASGRRRVEIPCQPSHSVEHIRLDVTCDLP